MGENSGSSTKVRGEQTYGFMKNWTTDGIFLLWIEASFPQKRSKQEENPWKQSTTPAVLKWMKIVHIQASFSKVLTYFCQLRPGCCLAHVKVNRPYSKHVPDCGILHALNHKIIISHCVAETRSLNINSPSHWSLLTSCVPFKLYCTKQAGWHCFSTKIFIHVYNP